MGSNGRNKQNWDKEKKGGGTWKPEDDQQGSSGALEVLTDLLGRGGTNPTISPFSTDGI